MRGDNVKSPYLKNTDVNGRNYINGEYCKTGKLFFESLSPFKQNIIGLVPHTTKEEVDLAIASAQEAFRVWGRNDKWSWVKRAEVMDAWVQLIKQERENIAIMISLESGKVLNESRAEVIEAIHMLQYCAGRGRMPIGYKISSEIPEKEAETYLAPKGVCGVITPWNFPFAIPTWLIGPALVSGNTVVFKPSEETPLTAQFLIYLFDQATRDYNIPPGILNLIQGDGKAGHQLMEHPDVKGLLFTGSYDVGSGIKKIAAASDEKFAICEMGGKNSLIVLADCDLEMAVNAAIPSAFKTTHQRCVSADMIIVEKKIERKFTKLFLKKAKEVKFGDPFADSGIFSGPMINERALNKHAHNISMTKKDAELLWGGGVLGDLLVEPTVFRMEKYNKCFATQEEFFTPLAVIVPVNDFEEALYAANNTKYGLSMALMTNDYRKMREFKIRGKAGLKYVNLPSIGAEVHLPFGGLRRSGTGMPSAAWLFNYLCHETAFTVNYGEEIKMAQGLSVKT